MRHPLLKVRGCGSEVIFTKDSRIGSHHTRLARRSSFATVFVSAFLITFIIAQRAPLVKGSREKIRGKYESKLTFSRACAMMDTVLLT
jgi:hypothetical protein